MRRRILWNDLCTVDRPGLLPYWLILPKQKHVRLCEIRLHASSAARWLPRSVQTPLCLCGLQARVENRELHGPPARVSPQLGREELPDQRCEQGHRHRRQVHRCRRRHRWSGRIRGGDWNRVRLPDHRLRQEPIPEAAAVLLCHPRIRPVRSHGTLLFDGRFPHSVRYVNPCCPRSL